MTMMIGRCLGLTAAAAVIALFAIGAEAQEKKAETPKATKTEKTEKKPAACKTLKTQAPCETRTDCNWVGATKDAEGKVAKRAYCRGNAGTVKKADAKKADPKKADPKKN